MARGSVGRTLVRSQKRPTFWEGAIGVNVVTTGAVQTATVVTEATLENVPSPTLVRIHGQVTGHCSAIGAAGATAVLAFGIIGQSARSIAAGVGGMPTPGGNIGSPWILHRQIPLDVPVAVTENAALTQNFRIDIDNKSMRKFELNQGMVIVFQNSVLVSTLTVDVTWAFRFLFKR